MVDRETLTLCVGEEDGGVWAVDLHRGDKTLVDGVSETEGLAVAPGPLPGFPHGILVVQDGHNVAPAENQNFKIVDWRVVEALLAAP